MLRLGGSILPKIGIVGGPTSISLVVAEHVRAVAAALFRNRVDCAQHGAGRNSGCVC
jgi:hypothetical protein